MPGPIGKTPATDLSNREVGGGPRNNSTVSLVPVDPGLPPRTHTINPDTQCDCACFAVEGETIPTLQAPVSFYLELTAACNNRCPSCGNAFLARGTEQEFGVPPPLAAQQWKQILNKLRPYAYRLKLTGGEPTMHPEFEAIVETISRLNIPFTLFSNGRWQNPEKLCALLKATPCFEGFLISLHGPTPASHKAFTNEPDSFAETLLNARTAVKAGLPVSLSCVITSHNWHLVDDMLRIARRVGAEGVVFNRFLGLDHVGLAATPEELQTAIHSVRALRAAGEPVKFGNCLPECFAPTGQAGCLAGIAFFTLDPWGRVRPCNHVSALCGNLLEQTVEEVWHSPNMELWRNRYPHRCRECAAFATCRGGCRAQAIALNLPADPLMGAPLSLPFVQPGLNLTFYERARPLGHFARLSEEFGTLLILGNRLFPVSRDMQDILDRLDGKSTLRQIESAHGARGMALIASLYQQGMIEIKT
jgi:radical SAM protein with 4Fe4S-binding SPASM domain